MKKTLLSYTCEKRSQYIIDGAACVQAFLRCCKEMETLDAEEREDKLVLARSICVAKPLSVVARKDFFVKLHLPYSVVRGEQVQIKAVVYNYRSQASTVRVDLKENDKLCSAASRRGFYRQEIRIPSRSTRSVPFVIIPLGLGLLDIEVQAAVKGRDSDIRDGIKKKLFVVSEGKLMNKVVHCSLDPTRKGGRDEATINSRVSTQDLVPGAPTSTMVFVTGYNNELNFRKPDGSFAVYQSRPGSTWLTAFVAKVFAMAHKLAAVKEEIVCDALTFLMNQQQDNGRFRDIGTILSQYMIGDLRGKDSDASMTAFCLMAMQEAGRLCPRLVTLQSSIDKAIGYLEGRLPAITNAYAVTITSCALASENKLDRQILKRFMSADKTHWPVDNSEMFTIEATAYGLLALVKVKALDEAKPVVKWFQQYEDYLGGYRSTQVTIMVYQAIAEYWSSVTDESYDMNINLKLPGRSGVTQLYITRENYMSTKSDELAKGPSRVIQGYETNTEGSSEDKDQKRNRGTLIIYLDKISHTEEEEITFRLHQKVLGNRLQPAAVTIYEYYDLHNQNDTNCVRFYHPIRPSGELLMLCRHGECTCAEVFKVKVVNITEEMSTDIYTMQVVQVIKDGTDRGALGRHREFLSYKHCKWVLDLVPGKTYLIMGADKDIRIDPHTRTHQYVLGERTWIEYWPTDEECQSQEHADVCKGIAELKYKYDNFYVGSNELQRHKKSF
ncbi:hypothetical protein INR49_026429 [Caranx melampygus]|nr:hypothetical protein INR49_026429 [Caranx melampygus]